MDEHQLDKGQVDDTSREMFGVGVRELNKLQASGLIDRIIEDNAPVPTTPTASSPRETSRIM